MFFLYFIIACVPKKQVKTGLMEDKIQDVIMPVIDLEVDPLPLEETIIVAGEAQNKEWKAIPESVKQGLTELEKEFQVLYEITYKQDDDDYNSNRLLIEKKQEVLDFGAVAVLFYEKDRHFEERCASAFFSGYAELRYREMALNYSLPSHLSPLAKALLLDKLDKKGAPPRNSGAGLIERIVNTYMRREVKSAYADRAITVLAEYLPEKYRLPYKGAGVEAYVDALNLESGALFIPTIKWEGDREQKSMLEQQVQEEKIVQGIVERCSDMEDEVILFCTGANISNALSHLYLLGTPQKKHINTLQNELEAVRTRIKGYWKERLEANIREANREVLLKVYQVNKDTTKTENLSNSSQDLDVIPYIFEGGTQKSRSQFAKKEHAIGHMMRVKYNLRMLEDRMVDIPKTRYQRRRYVKSYPKQMKDLAMEAQNVLYSYEDIESYRRGMLLVMARVGYRYHKNAVYAYKGASSIAEHKLDQERGEAYVLSRAIFRYLSLSNECDDSCLEAKRFLKKY
ncbi:MAG: hypothetical protein CL916_12310 [Deltaproteobacteria bacterium]|nr:hypothetical protein [Deltaproteobacteria bacterium]